MLTNTRNTIFFHTSERHVFRHLASLCHQPGFTFLVSPASFSSSSRPPSRDPADLATIHIHCVTSQHRSWIPDRYRVRDDTCGDIALLQHVALNPV